MCSDRSPENSDEPTELDASAEHLEAIVETAHDGIITIDRDGIVLAFNSAAEAMFGYDRTEVVGENVSMLMPQPHRSRHDDYLRRYLETGEAHIIGLGREVEAVRKDGERFPIHLSVSEFEAEGTTFFAGFIRNLTAQKQLEDQARRAQKMEAIGTLTTGVAHDFNNVLMAISGHAQMALAKMDEDDRTRRHVESVKHAVARGAGLTRELLDFTRSENGEGRPLLPDSTLRDLEPLLEPLVTRDVELEIELNADETYIQCEPGHLDQILMNLVVNARDASQSGDTVRIRTDAVDVDEFRSAQVGQLYPGRYFVLSVSDDGEGMTAETLEHVFDPFFTTKSVGEGTGLGLSTTYGIVQQWDGAIEVESTPGDGTTFRVYFGALDRNELPDDLEPLEQEEGSRRLGQNERIAVLDDDARSRRAIAQYLQHGNYHPIEFASYDELNSLLEREPGLDAAVVDLLLDGKPGTEIARWLRSEIPGLPVLFVSGYSDPAAHEELLASGTDVLDKPFAAETLLSALGEALDAAEKAAPSTRTAERRPESKAGKPSTVLVVEDDELARRATCELLEQEQYETIAAGTGTETLAALERDGTSIDVVVVDLTLPDGDGDDLVRKIRSEYGMIPAVFVSGVDPQAHDVSELLQEPRTDFLQKPVDIDRLFAAIEDVNSR